MYRIVHDLSGLPKNLDIYLSILKTQEEKRQAKRATQTTRTRGNSLGMFMFEIDNSRRRKGSHTKWLLGVNKIGGDLPKPVVM